MDPIIHDPLNQTRRHFFQDCRVGLGALALGTILNADQDAATAATKATQHPLSPRPAHFPPQVKNVIFLFMAGGPSQLELFDHKPKLQSMEGQVIPESYVENKRFAFLKKMPNCWVRAANSSNMALQVPRYQSASLTWHPSVTNWL